MVFASPRNLPRTPSAETNGGVLLNPQVLEIKNELENGNSAGARMFRRQREELYLSFMGIR